MIIGTFSCTQKLTGNQNSSQSNKKYLLLFTLLHFEPVIAFTYYSRAAPHKAHCSSPVMRMLEHTGKLPSERPIKEKMQEAHKVSLYKAQILSLKCLVDLLQPLYYRHFSMYPSVSDDMIVVLQKTSNPLKHVPKQWRSQTKFLYWNSLGQWSLDFQSRSSTEDPNNTLAKYYIGDRKASSSGIKNYFFAL